ncbi:unnamed protein product, partial [Iphiclides podalirius]
MEKKRKAHRAAAWGPPGRVWSWRWTWQHAGRQPSAGYCTTTKQYLASIIPTSWLGVGRILSDLAPAAGGIRRLHWTEEMNRNAMRAYLKAKGSETGGFAYRARMHRFFAELEPSITVTEQNLADRVRYIMRSKIFDDTELERLRREAVPSSDENVVAGDTAPQAVDPAGLQADAEAAVNPPAPVESCDDGIVAQEIEQMGSILEEAILEVR